jgi:hypothetical protein
MAVQNSEGWVEACWQRGMKEKEKAALSEFRKVRRLEHSES